MLNILVHNGTYAKKIRGSLVCGYQNVNRYTSIGSPNQTMVRKWDFCDQTSKSYRSFFWDQEMTNLVLLHFPFQSLDGICISMIRNWILGSQL